MPVCCARSCREPQLMVMGGTGDMGQCRNLLPCHFYSYLEVWSALSCPMLSGQPKPEVWKSVKGDKISLTRMVLPNTSSSA